MSYHRCKDVNSAIIRLLDSLCNWERSTGRKSKLLLVLEKEDGNNIIAFDGKPIKHIVNDRKIRESIMNQINKDIVEQW